MAVALRIFIYIKLNALNSRTGQKPQEISLMRQSSPGNQSWL